MKTRQLILLCVPVAWTGPKGRLPCRLCGVGPGL